MEFSFGKDVEMAHPQDDEESVTRGVDQARNRDLSSPEARYGERLRRNMSASVLRDRIMTAETTALHNTFEGLRDSDVLTDSVALILGARRKYIAGEGKSAAYAALLNADLASTVPNVYLIDEHALSTLNVLTDVRPSDVLILFSVRRYRRSSVRFGSLFREAGGKVVVITDSNDAPPSAAADRVIVADTGSASFADSPTALAAVCHLLSTLATASAKGARRRLAQRDTLQRELDLYVSTDEERRSP